MKSLVNYFIQTLIMHVLMNVDAEAYIMCNIKTVPKVY